MLVRSETVFALYEQLLIHLQNAFSERFSGYPHELDFYTTRRHPARDRGWSLDDRIAVMAAVCKTIGYLSTWQIDSNAPLRAIYGRGDGIKRSQQLIA